MDMNSTDPDCYQRSEAIDRFGGSLVNVILGALILWVGQTTFRHAGLLASVHERFDGVSLQFNAVDSRHDTLRERLEQVTSQTTERTRSRFTREDADKMAQRIKEIHEMHTDLERQLVDRVTSLQLKVIALETHGSDSQKVASLRAEVERLRARVVQQPTGYYSSASATTRPTYLPPVTQHR